MADKRNLSSGELEKGVPETPNIHNDIPLALEPRESDRGAITTIYFIRGEQTRLIKIGHSGWDVKKRLARIQAYSPDKLTLLWHYTAPDEHEFDLHWHFRKVRAHGEWFQGPGPVLQYIKERQPRHFVRERGCEVIIPKNRWIKSPPPSEPDPGFWWQYVRLSKLSQQQGSDATGSPHVQGQQNEGAES